MEENMRILKAKEVAERTSISIPHIRRLARDGKFPEPIPLTENRSGWLEADVDEWISERVRSFRIYS
jgi:prophage regulatory protein